MDFMYDYGDGVYFNLTNRCPCRCEFCIRSKVDALGSAENLWLKNEPSVDEVINAICKIDLFAYKEVVFCGYGEPMERAQDVVEIADFIRNNYALPVRMNTNGLGDLIQGRDTVDLMEGHLDAISISLNASNSERYMELCRPKFGEDSYPAILDFARRAVARFDDVTMSVVDVITPEEIEECRQIAKKIGAKFRVRGCY